MRKLLLLLPIFFFGCGEASHQEKLEMWKEATTFMKEHDMAGTASLSWRGVSEVYLKEAAGMDTGADFKVSVQFNSVDDSD
jgi:hypothetical protein